MGNITTLGIDLAKSIFHLHGVDQHGKVILKKRLDREKLLANLAKLPICLIGLEACSSGHYWAREIRKLGHDVRLMHPTFVKPYVKNDKNDFNDAEGICEAVARPNMRFVPVKTVEQQDVQSLHRVSCPRLPGNGKFRIMTRTTDKNRRSEHGWIIQFDPRTAHGNRIGPVATRGTCIHTGSPVWCQQQDPDSMEE